MFDNLSQRLQVTLKRLRGQGRLTEENTREALREVRMALLEADVALAVVKDFIEHVRVKATGHEVLASLTPGQALIKVVYDELVALMGAANEKLNLAARPPVVILVAGLQGSGKTTTVAKLARFLREREAKSVMVVSADVYRPAAIEQLQKLAAAVGAEFFPSRPDQKPVDIARQAVDEARKRVMDVLIVDSAGRLHVDGPMMQEIRAIHAALEPVETLFVVDSMTGQDAVNTAKAFNEVLPLTGVILTKTDGDARGGAALSIRQVTGKPIKFMGVGEKPAALEAFYPDRVAARILGMGDVLGLVEQASLAADKEKAQEFAQKLSKGKGFDLEDFRDQLMQMEKMGGLASLMEKLPGAGEVSEAAKSQLGDRQVSRLVAIINSMTPQERNHPDAIRGSRKRRIAAGSGTQVQDVNRLLKQFDQMQKVMKRMGKGGLQKMLRDVKGRLPGMPG
ncbi:MAG: signal recognition particle protein [Sulfuricaulis sp.]|uniref:signal recognition particle protein n=1 Tax=Sulfuricaulis sp. TaxID=2003553 RepID=UPI0025F97BBC|nr:signal recognition particle protein [Sulfuricaulis sp.]MCR4345594.1 signal recognition particle protein [Sulfuricaulis sp.]